MALARERGLVFVHPFDDPDVIAGQGTIGVEIVRQSGGNLDAIFVPVGGGGLIAGIAVYMKYLYPTVKIIGVEPQDAAGMHDSLKAGKRVTLERVGIFADGVAVKRVGEETFTLCRAHVDEIMLVTTDEICAAIQDVFEDTRSIVEPAGALAVAGIKKYLAPRGLARPPRGGDQQRRQHELRPAAPRRRARRPGRRARGAAGRGDSGAAGQLPALLRDCSGSAASPSSTIAMPVPAARRSSSASALTQGRAEKDLVLRTLREAQYTVTDMTDNEMAKLHVRYMVGGHAGGLADEVLYRFEFPERPGALLRFLQAIGTRWNISLFHYRNHGSDYGRVLAGIQVPPGERADFLQHLNELHYAYVEETRNPAYRMFLGA